MTVRVLVVDDSGFFRRRITEILSNDARLEVVGSAENGMEAVRQVKALKPDVVTMDIEMPVMDGISAVRKIMAEQPTPVLMFSTLSYEGGKATLDALEAGAVDFLPKRFEDMAKDRESGAQTLCARVYQLGSKRGGLGGRPATSPPSSTGTPKSAVTPPVSPKTSATPASRSTAGAATKLRGVKLVAIGASTGGPVALQQVLMELPASFSAPIIIVQHMPANFTKAFADRLDQQCKISVKEAEDGDELRPGVALLAPGGKQLLLERAGVKTTVSIKESKPDMTYKPCVDVSFGSASRVFSNGVLAIVLTGMGADGREGARLLKEGGSSVWAQDEASCVIYGMPAAIVQGNLADRVLPLKEIGSALSSAM